MGNESDGGARMEEIGAMIVHAEAAQAALDKGLAAHAENVVNITRLIQYGGGVLKKLQAEAEQLGPRAEQAGAGAVREEVRESLAGAGAVVGDAARGALRPVMADVVAGIGEAHRAGMSLDEKAELFSNRMLAIMAAVAIGALMVVVLGVWVALAWQRSEIASLRAGKSRFTWRDRRHDGSFTKDAVAGAENRVPGLQRGQRSHAPLRRRSAGHAALGNRAGTVLCAERILRRGGGESLFDHLCGYAKNAG